MTRPCRVLPSASRPGTASLVAMTTPVHIVRSFEATPSRLFDLWVAPTTLIGPVTEIDMDPVVGGTLWLSTGGDDPSGSLRGRFVIVDRPERLRYTWRWGSSPEETMIDVVFTPAGTTTVVTVEHLGFLDEASRATHLDGWVTYLDGLAGFL